MRRVELVSTLRKTRLFITLEVVFWKFWKIPEFILDGSIFSRCRIKRSIVWSYSDFISITLGKVLKPGPRHLGWAFWWKSEKPCKSWFSSRPGSQNKVFKPGGAALPRSAFVFFVSCLFCWFDVCFCCFCVSFMLMYVSVFLCCVSVCVYLRLYLRLRNEKGSTSLPGR